MANVAYLGTIKMANGFASLSAWLDKYKIIWYILLAVFIAVGFDFKTPSQRFRLIEERISGMEAAAAVDRGNVNTANLKLTILLRIECNRNREQTRLAGYDCP